ncbi:F-box-like domain protein, partial [Rhizoctonia solani 123E]
MSLGNHNHTYYQLNIDLKAARGKLVDALDQYADLCLIVRNTHHQTSFKDIQPAGFPWSDVAPELLHIPLLETRLQEATQNLNRAYELGQARSSSAYSHPINKLPDEILAHIFCFATGTRPQDSHPIKESGTKLFPQYPDSLAQTCARWRQVALTCSALWTRIQLASHPTHFDSILDHAKLYAKRAGHHSLELYITDIQDEADLDLDSNIDGLGQFIVSIAPRTKSLEIVRSGSYTSEFEKESLAGVLQGCSEIFTGLAVCSKSLTYPGFIRPLDDDNKGWDMEVDLSPEQIERGLAHLTLLHTSQIFPPWGSTAYQGLVDLRLMPNHQFTYECPTIDAFEFIGILEASPHLRILHFGLDLNLSSHDASLDKVNVRLDDLEVLYLSASETYSPEDTEYEI